MQIKSYYLLFFFIELHENIRAPANILDLTSVLNKEVKGQGDFSFEIIGSDHGGIFKIDHRTGYLQITESPNREQRETYLLNLKTYLKPPSSEREVPVFFYTLYVQVLLIILKMICLILNYLEIIF